MFVRVPSSGTATAGSATISATVGLARAILPSSTISAAVLTLSSERPLVSARRVFTSPCASSHCLARSRKPSTEPKAQFAIEIE